MKTLTDVRKYLDNVPEINSGGCAIAALAMYLWLEKTGTLADDTCIVYMYRDYSKRAYMDNKKVIDGKSNNGNACSHAFLFHNGEYIDTEEVLEKKPKYKYTQKIPFTDKFFKLSLQSDNWNWMFKREHWVPRIEKKLKINISEYI